MDNKSEKEIAIISAIVIVAIICGGLGIYKYSKGQTYNNLVTTANKDMDQGEYEQAIALFNQSLQYKDNDNVKNNIKLATKLKEVKSTFDEGTQLMNSKKYLDAIEQFEKVSKEDSKIYGNAQKDIQECKKEYIAQNIQLSNNAVKNTKYDEANNYLDSILKLDSNNAEAKKLKDDVEKSIQKQKDEVVAKGKVEVNKNATTSSTGNIDTQAKAYDLVLSVPHLHNDTKIVSLGSIKIDSSSYIPSEARGETAYSFEENDASTETGLAVYYVDMQGRVYRNTFPMDGKCIKLR